MRLRASPHYLILSLLTHYFLSTSSATSTPNANLSLIPTTNATNDIEGYCFDKESRPGIGYTDSADCRRVLRLISDDHHYRDRTPLRFSKNPRNGIRVPKGWQYDDCLIYISCQNDRDADTFTLMDIFKAAVTVIKDCVDETLAKYGGIEGVGSVGTFYVSVGRPDNPRPVVSSSSLSGMSSEATGTTTELLFTPALDDLSEGITNISVALS